MAASKQVARGLKKQGPHTPKAHGGAGTLRIIGGIFRGRKIEVIASEGFRPTPDRVRETLFNWLGPYVPGSVCLDLFAGSGALCLEALSRGASRVTLVERALSVAANLRTNVDRLTDAAAANHDAIGVAEVVASDALGFLSGPVEPMGPVDIVFVDPPFAHPELIAQCFARLSERGWLKDRAWVYVEAECARELPALPGGWELYRSKQAGQVGYHLIRTA